MADVVLDANVIVGLLDGGDALAARARTLRAAIAAVGDHAALVDFLFAEAMSVLARRSRERKHARPDFDAIAKTAIARLAQGHIVFLSDRTPAVFGRVLDVMRETGGALNFNDGLVVVLQRDGVIGDVASFDVALDLVPGFRRREA